MTASLSRGETPEGRVLAAALEPIRQRTRMDMVFGGAVRQRVDALEITELQGTRTRSAWNLVVHNGHGIGGRALELRRPVLVPNYFTSEGITHVYDHAVRPEAIQTIAAVPVMVGRAPRALLYMATRTQVSLGDRWFDAFAPMIRALERDLTVEDEVHRRLSALRDVQASRPDMVTSAELSALARELGELATSVEDVELRKKLEAIGSRMVSGVDAGSRSPRIELRPREVDVLREVATGASNGDVAAALDLQISTVKSYLKSAMRKLHATNRVQAINAAQRERLI